MLIAGAGHGRGLLHHVLLTAIGSAPCHAARIASSRFAFDASLPSGLFFNNFRTTPNAFSAPVASVTRSGGTTTVEDPSPRFPSGRRSCCSAGGRRELWGARGGGANRG